MSVSTLTENLSSDYIEAVNALLPQAAPKQILVYVESYDDISFWRNTLHDYENNHLKFDVQISTHKGKNGALERSNDLLLLNVGEYLIICVDSDYDYLLPNLNDDSRLINENPHIFQTYSYSIENLQCYSESLHPVCVQATKYDKRLIDFNIFLKDFSKIVYPLFLWNVYFRKENNHENFTISAFCDIIKLLDKIDVNDQFSIAIKGLKSRVTIKSAELEANFPEAKENIKELADELSALGITEDNTYLFIQGHTLKENIVLMVLKPICDILIKEKLALIKQHHADNAEHIRNEVNQYRNQKQAVNVVLDLHTNFKNCFLFQKVRADLDRYIQTLQ